jgi:putative tricarboxylic transport membrane protein
VIRTDRVFGVVVFLLALAYIASALQIETTFLPDPVGPKTFPILIASIAIICAGVMVFRPDPEPEWPALPTLLALGLSVVVLVGYAYALKPLGFLLPTAIAAGVLSYQISPRPRFAVLAGFGLSVGLFLVFKYALGLSLFALPRSLMG